MATETMEKRWETLANRSIIARAGLSGLLWFLSLSIGTALVVGAVRGNREASQQHRRRESVEREVERLRLQNEALRAEVRSLEQDPMYLEAILQERGIRTLEEKPVGE